MKKFLFHRNNSFGYELNVPFARKKPVDADYNKSILFLSGLKTDE